MYLFQQQQTQDACSFLVVAAKCIGNAYRVYWNRSKLTKITISNFEQYFMIYLVIIRL